MKLRNRLILRQIRHQQDDVFYLFILQDVSYFSAKLDQNILHDMGVVMPFTDFSTTTLVVAFLYTSGFFIWTHTLLRMLRQRKKKQHKQFSKIQPVPVGLTVHIGVCLLLTFAQKRMDDQIRHSGGWIFLIQVQNSDVYFLFFSSRYVSHSNARINARS